MASEQVSTDQLLPCPWCKGTDIGIYIADGTEYAQCRNCTACGPDHKNGLHWNKRPAEDELERERIRLAACGVAALGYYKGCAPEYDSASLQDVLRLRAKVEALLENPPTQPDDPS